jgi:hypothetical protein
MPQGSVRTEQRKSSMEVDGLDTSIDSQSQLFLYFLRRSRANRELAF